MKCFSPANVDKVQENRNSKSRSENKAPNSIAPLHDMWAKW